MANSPLRAVRSFSRGEHSIHTDAVDVQSYNTDRFPHRDSNRHSWPIALRVTLVANVTLLFRAIASAVLATPDWSFNGTRLIPSFLLASGHKVLELRGQGRSEERRVGKEWRSRWS